MEIKVIVPFNHFPRLAGNLERHVLDAQRKALLNVVAYADTETPVDTGALRANKTIDDTSVTWNQEYAAYVETGTYRMAPTPFAQTAVDRALPAFVQELSTLGFS